MRTAEQILQSLIADIEGMANPVPVKQLGFDDEPGSNDHKPKDFFGPFTSYMDEGEGFMVDGGRVTVEWPNLRILIDEAKQVITPK